MFVEWFKYYFRGIEDGYSMTLFSPIHIALICIWAIGIYLIFANRKILVANKSLVIIPKVLAGILLLDQITLYTWQCLSGFFNLANTLPIFHCRISTPLFIIAILLGKQWAAKVAIYWGFMGSLLAVIMVDLYKFSPLHYTNIQFFLVHIFLGWLVAYMIFVREYRFPKADLKFMLMFTNIYNLGILFTCKVLISFGIPANYGYMIHLPDPLRSFSYLIPASIHPAVAFCFYNLVILGIWALGRAVLVPLTAGFTKSELDSSYREHQVNLC